MRASKYLPRERASHCSQCRVPQLLVLVLQRSYVSFMPSGHTEAHCDSMCSIAPQPSQGSTTYMDDSTIHEEETPIKL